MNDLFAFEADIERRRKRLPRRLQSLTNVAYIQAYSAQVGFDCKVIGLCKGGRPPTSYRDWRVSLTQACVSISYYEAWQRSKRPDGSICFLLQRAYLHVYRTHSSGAEEELLSLHCDPYEPETSPHHRYKIAPHLHFDIAKDPWRNAHIPLCDGWQDQVLKSLDTLDDAIARAIQFIVEEFIPLVPTYT